MLESQIVAYDPGFQFTKGYSRHGKYMSLARVVEAPPNRQPHEGETIVEIDGARYQVGDSLKNAKPDLNHDKTQSMKTKVELMNYLHQITEGERGAFTVITGTPLSKSETESGLEQTLMTYLSTNGQYIDIVRNNIKKSIKISNIFAVPQAFITYYALPEELRERFRKQNATVLIWDLGGHTFDVAEFIGGSIQKDPETKLYTRNAGIIPMLEHFRKRLDSRYPTLDFPSSEALRKIFEAKTLSGPKGIVDVNDLVDVVARQHVHGLVQDMSLVFNPKTADENILCGGGFLTLAPYVQEIFPLAWLIEDAQFSNVKAMWKVASNDKMLMRLTGLVA